MVDDQLDEADALSVVAHELAHHIAWLFMVETEDEERFCGAVADAWLDALGDLLARRSGRLKKTHALPLEESVQVESPLDDRLVLAVGCSA
jgi:hypothetical protein